MACVNVYAKTKFVINKKMNILDNIIIYQICMIILWWWFVSHPMDYEHDDVVV